jgi:hypothetical protein
MRLFIRAARPQPEHGRMPACGNTTGRTARMRAMTQRSSSSPRMTAPLATFALGLLLLHVTTAGAAAPTPCIPSDAKVIVRGDAVTVFEDDEDIEACYRPTRTRYFIGVTQVYSPGDELATHVVVAGRFVAWAERDNRLGLSNFRVFRHDLEHDRLRAWASGSSRCADDACGFGLGPANKVVINPRGSLAWVASAADGGPTAEVWRYDRRGLQRLVRGEDVEKTFLRRRNDLIEWRQAGMPRRAALKP